MKLVGTPSFAIVAMRLTSIGKKLAAVGHTLPNDIRLLHGSGEPAGRDMPHTGAVPSPGGRRVQRYMRHWRSREAR
jgi:hypothetical protein